MTSTSFFILFIPFLAILLLFVNLLLAPHNPYQEKDSAFECGFHSFLGQNRTQFSISFFIFGLLFLLFDLEILLVYPYSVSAYTTDIYGLAIMMIFFILLTLGFIFELGKNALSIESKQIYSFFEWWVLHNIPKSHSFASIPAHNDAMKLFNLGNFCKIVTIFLFGFSTRYLINDLYSINVFAEYTHWVSIVYYFFFAFFSLVIKEVFEWITFKIPVLDINLKDVIRVIKFWFSSLHEDKKIILGNDKEMTLGNDKEMTLGNNTKNAKDLLFPYLKMENQPGGTVNITLTTTTAGSSTASASNAGSSTASASNASNSTASASNSTANAITDSSSVAGSLRLNYTTYSSNNRLVSYHCSISREFVSNCAQNVANDLEIRRTNVLNERIANGNFNNQARLYQLGYNFNRIHSAGISARLNTLSIEEQNMYVLYSTHRSWFDYSPRETKARDILFEIRRIYR